MSVSLEARELTCTLSGRPVVEAVSLAVQPGEVLALIGPNGAGKTTLLRALGRLLRPSGGVALIGGRPIWQLGARATARMVAMAAQSAGQSPLTVEQLVSLGRAPSRGWLLPLTAHDRAAIERAMERAGIVHLRDRPATTLSGGEQHRVVLARALAQEPQALLLDEPTAALDLRFQVAVLDLARQLAHSDGLAVVLTLHDLNQAALVADRVALMANGRLLAIGAPSEVLNANLLARAYGVPVAVGSHPIYGTPLVTPLFAAVPEPSPLQV